MTPIWYIHGAFASPRSFEWLKGKIGPHDATNVEYTCGRGVATVLAEMEAQVREAGEIDIIGHSLGGVLATILSRRCPNVRRVVTMASPFGGSRIASLLQFVTPGTFMREVQPLSPIMIEARKPLRVPVLSLITTLGGSPVMMEPNDGVVTVKSQKAHPETTKVEVSANHFEVLLHEHTETLIRQFLVDQN